MASSAAAAAKKEAGGGGGGGQLPGCLVVGTGEYVTGWTPSGASGSDKRVGVVALVAFDLRARGVLGSRIALCGTDGAKLPKIRAHFEENIRDVYSGLDVSFEPFPADPAVRDGDAYKAAVASMEPGDLCVIVTPDDTHFPIAQAALERGLHVLLTKPPVRTLGQHHELQRLAAEKGLLCQVEYHKRFDPVYSDARERIRALGPFSFFQSYMSQPKAQLETFKSWAGVSSDISYYLNSHHIDFHCWSMQGRATPRVVTAMASRGVATSPAIGCPPGTEDTITLMVQWASEEEEAAAKEAGGEDAGESDEAKSSSVGTATYTASWIAPKSDVHSQQRFFCMCRDGEVTASQAHRGYAVATDLGKGGLASPNPLYMRYTPDALGRFAGQAGYGYTSIESFVRAASAVRGGERTPADFDASLPTLAATVTTTAILEAGYTSLKNGGAPCAINIRDGDIVDLDPTNGAASGGD